MQIKFDENSIRLITAFESLTGVSVRDCVVDESSNTAYILVESGKLGLAIGKEGKNIKKVEEVVKKRMKLYEFSEDIVQFTKKFIPQANRVNLTNGLLEVYVDKKDRAIVIGRDGKKINIIKAIFRRNFGIEDVVIR